jgi:prepilin-type N-terminal cleavage/methylation domain-containing protein
LEGLSVKSILNFKFKILNSQSGFTLIEALVATALFSVVVGSIMGVYLSTFQLDRRTRAERSINQNARYILEFLAKEVHNGSISYSSYPGGLIGASQDLWITNQALETEQFRLTGTDLVLTKGASSTNMNSAGVRVTNLHFYIAPDGDPYTASSVANGLNVQPHVTVVLELTSNYGDKPGDMAKFNYQNTFSTRVYTSRQ